MQPKGPNFHIKAGVWTTDVKPTVYGFGSFTAQGLAINLQINTPIWYKPWFFSIKYIKLNVNEHLYMNTQNHVRLIGNNRHKGKIA